jgi:hypothetical protein
MCGGKAAAMMAAIAALAILAGCGTTAKPAVKAGFATDASEDEAPRALSTQPKMISNLTQLAEPSLGPPTGAQNLIAGAAVLHDNGSPPNSPQSLADRNLEHLYLSQQRGNLVHGSAVGGLAAGAGDRTLLNAKARQFPEFSYTLLNQTLSAAQELEAKRLAQQKLPDEIKPLIVVATLTPDGQLTDLAIAQHTGLGTIDRILIDACKQGLWARNPPRGAMTDGVFRMRFEGVIDNDSYDVDGNYHYVIHVGLALM